MLKKILKRFVAWFDTEAGLAEKMKKGELPNKVDIVRIMPYIFLHVACFGVIWVGFSWFAMCVAIVLYLIRMFAITGFYHRYFSHRTFKTNRFWQFLFALLGASSVQRGPLWWAAHHRHHHRHSDQPDDLHSPVQKGFWWSHTFWFLTERNFVTDLSKIKDFAKFPELRFLNRFDNLVPISLAVFLFGLGMILERAAPGLNTSGPQLLIWGFFISTIVLSHATFTINSLSHVFGRRRFKTTDTSRNNVFLAMLTLGEGWHNNHHRFPGSVRQGFYWWEVDITYIVLKIMSKLGIVWDLRPVPERILDEGRNKRNQEQLPTRDVQPSEG